MNKLSTYIKFIQLKRGMGLDILDEISVEILEAVALRSAESPYQIGELVALGCRGLSPSKLRKKIQFLIENNYLTIAKGETDRRIGYVSITSKALEYFERLNQAICDAMQTQTQAPERLNWLTHFKFGRWR